MTARRKRIFRRRSGAPEQARQDLAVWFDSVPGRFILADEQQSLDTHLGDTAGYRAMLLEAADSGFSLDAGPQLHKFTISPSAGGRVAARSDLDALPLPSDVVELAVLHHVLDYTEYPHEALKESSRVVQASGHLIVVGFNPWSFYGLWCLFGRLFSSRAVWRSRCLSVSRVGDWLKLVGFQPERVSYGVFRPPFRKPGMMKKSGSLERFLSRWQLPLGNYYVITARKIRLRPIRGRQEWLAQAMKPVKLASRTRAEKEMKRTDDKTGRNIH